MTVQNVKNIKKEVFFIGSKRVKKWGLMWDGVKNGQKSICDQLLPVDVIKN